MIGEKVEQYLIQEKLGKGAMGSVYLALDTLLDRPVALKFILSDFNDHPDMTRRFLAEAKVLASLNRPNIPILYGYFIWDGNGVMAMEYVDGETLDAMVKRRGPIPANVTVPIIKQALQGLACAHRIGVVHRDLKPGNLMLNKEGTVKVVDFGIAKKIELEAGLTGTNMTLGTPWYMAPEQIMGKPVDARTDIYSMGVVLYELLAGQVPFNAESMYEIQVAHVQQIPRPPTIHYPHIPAQVVDAVMKALQKDPAQRFASAEEFLNALPDLPTVQTPMPLAAPGPVAVAPPPPPPPVPSSASAPPAPQVSRSAAAAPHNVHAGSGAGEDSTEGSGRKVLIAGAIFALLLLITGGVTWFLLNSNKKPPLAAVHPSPPVSSGASAASPAENTDTPSPVTVAPAKPPAQTEPAHPKDKPVAKQGGVSVAAGTTKVPLDIPPRPTLVTQPTPGQELSGAWKGTYADSTSQDKTVVQLRIQELNGKDVVGTLSFTKADNTSGECDLSRSSYNAEAQSLKLLLSHCKGSVPGYFNTPTTLSVTNPAGRLLSGKVYGFSNVRVDIRKE